MNVIALGWVVVISVASSLPPNELVLWTMLLLAALLAACWRVPARRTFVGPVAAPLASGPSLT